jgi:hypothetical protein
MIGGYGSGIKIISKTVTMKTKQNSERLITMKSIIFICTFLFIAQCSNPSHIIRPFQFHFQSDVNGIGLRQLHLTLKANDTGRQINIDSAVFFTCPDANDTCDRRIYWDKVPDYTKTVPMTPLVNDDYEFTGADGSVQLTITLNDSTEILLQQIFAFDQIMRNHFFLIYIGSKYDENNSKIGNFIKCLQNNTSDKPAHLSFPISGSAANNDSLYLIWINWFQSE